MSRTSSRDLIYYAAAQRTAFYMACQLEITGIAHKEASALTREPVSE